MWTSEYANVHLATAYDFDFSRPVSPRSDFTTVATAEPSGGSVAWACNGLTTLSSPEKSPSHQPCKNRLNVHHSKCERENFSRVVAELPEPDTRGWTSAFEHIQQESQLLAEADDPMFGDILGTGSKHSRLSPMALRVPRLDLGCQSHASVRCQGPYGAGLAHPSANTTNNRVKYVLECDLNVHATAFGSNGSFGPDRCDSTSGHVGVAEDEQKDITRNPKHQAKLYMYSKSNRTKRQKNSNPANSSTPPQALQESGSHRSNVVGAVLLAPEDHNSHLAYACVDGFTFTPPPQPPTPSEFRKSPSKFQTNMQVLNTLFSHRKGEALSPEALSPTLTSGKSNGTKSLNNRNTTF